MLLFRVKPRHVEKFQKCRFADVGKSELGKKRKKKHAQNIYMILYASEVTDPTKSVLAMLDNLIDRAVVKIFKVSKNRVIHEIRHFIGLHYVASLCETRHMKFLNKTRTLMHVVLQSLTEQFY